MNYIHEKLDLLGSTFKTVLESFKEDYEEKINSQITVRTFDWFQGVGLYGFYKLYKLTNQKKYLNILIDYYEKQISYGLPPITVNSTAPLLTLTFLNQELKNPKYDEIILDWADRLYNDLPRAINGAFNHVTSELENENQLWDDTLMMTVLFLAKVGIVYKKDEYVEDAIYQFLEHSKYLVDTSTDLWFHGFNVAERHHYGGVLWGRGNSWITIFIPEFLEILGEYYLMPSIKRYIIQMLNNQIKALAKYQDEAGMWHTVIDDVSSYLESSATAGFSYGILKSVRKGFIDKEYETIGLKGLEKVIENINDQGILENVSGGTRMGMSKDFYKDIPIKEEPFGQAMAMLALIEGLLH